MIRRFLRSLWFYCRAVGVKNTLCVELPEFKRTAKEEGLPLIEVMEENESYYID